MSSDGATTRPRFALFGRIWRTREYRTFLILMVLMSLAMSAGMPLTSLYLVRTLGVSLAVAGLFSTSIALPGLVLGVTLGRRSDRWRSRLPFLRGVAVWVAVGWLLLALSPLPWLTLSAGAVFLSVGGGLMGQVFAALHDVMTRDQEAQPTLVNATIRTGWSFGYVFGPLLGSALAARIDLRAPFIATACLYLICLIPLRGLDVAVPHHAAAPGAQGHRDRPTLALIAFTALCALVTCGQAIKTIYLPIDVTAHLGGSVGTYGTIVSVSPVVELVAMPLCGVLAQRFAVGRVIAVGLALGVLEYVLLTSSSMLWQLYLTQAMDACVVAVVMGLGMSYAQALSPGQAGMANGIFFSSFNVAFVLGGAVGSAGVPLLGVPHIFVIPAVLSGVAWVAFQIVERTARRAQPVSALVTRSEQAAAS